VSNTDQTLQTFKKAVEIMATLRSKTGCEWDREQTHLSLKPYIIEEAYEVAQAIEEKNPQHLKEELGDVLLQILFHAQIAEEEEEFTFAESIQYLNDKLIRRHPHVFGNTSSGHSYKQWEEIKAKERGKEKSSRVGEYNKALPALLMARRVQENASSVGFDWKEAKDAFYKIEEEKNEIEKLLSQESTDMSALEIEIGDLLFSVVNVARLLKIDPELALRRSTYKFITRFQRMERYIEEQGLVLEEQTLESLDRFWERAKIDEFHD
jgi:tetrapyrrole methylase family protein/MazG family protein